MLVGLSGSIVKYCFMVWGLGLVIKEASLLGYFFCYKITIAQFAAHQLDEKFVSYCHCIACLSPETFSFLTGKGRIGKIPEPIPALPLKFLDFKRRIKYHYYYKSDRGVLSQARFY